MGQQKKSQQLALFLLEAKRNEISKQLNANHPRTDEEKSDDI
jgi:hypothetical protein